jgi:hypothetical protein
VEVNRNGGSDREKSRSVGRPYSSHHYTGVISLRIAARRAVDIRTLVSLACLKMEASSPVTRRGTSALSTLVHVAQVLFAVGTESDGRQPGKKAAIFLASIVCL